VPSQDHAPGGHVVSTGRSRVAGVAGTKINDSRTDSGAFDA
jgi:hypothetical protein